MLRELGDRCPALAPPTRVILLDNCIGHIGAFGVLPARGNTVAVIPCLNEARAIGGIVTLLLSRVRSVIVVDDGSSDDTASAATQAGARVERHPVPRGKGAALATGWTLAGSLGAEWILLLDGDGQHDPADANGFFAAAADPVRMVVGNRMPQAHAMPWLRRQTNRWMSRRISALAGIAIPDSQCGYRLVHLPSLAQLGLCSQRFEIESEMLVTFARAGLAVAFAPVQVHYRDERSKISPVRDTLRWICWYRSTRSAAPR